MPSPEQIKEAQNKRLRRFVGIYKQLHTRQTSPEELVAAIKTTGAPRINIMNSMNFMSYLESVTKTLDPSHNTNEEDLF